ncbi:HlyD family secretion protein [Methylobacterium sp. NEAU K]|uniref:HlyD family secretion protein n=1 Tax=Methylobacterium sp. NEAU K TaxID=3064946 RepID=UPI0027364918|nr:HlyD family secretion protein [Methylobacterium sp. NEAU K]MDP4003358.1 HlyD family secretion protein [Methylobacterium sp. NEAU K]
MALLTALGGGGTYGWHWWTVGRFLETTEDAYLQADKVTVASRVAGHVAEVMVGDNQPVKAGDVVARLDDREYRIMLKQADAEVEKSRAQLLGTAAAITQQMAQVESARAEVENTDAALDFAGKEYARYQNLLQTGSGTVQRQQQADADLRQKRAAHDKALASLEAAKKQVESFKALEGSARASLEAAQAKVEQAKLNLTYTTITAPADGVVGDRSARVGQFVSAGTGLLTVVPMGRDLYLVANFKETQTGRIVEGQRVTFTVDMFGDHEFGGRVDSFAPGTGSQFALLPPENATGNFTKVVQRVPVRIALDDTDPMLARLRPGLSVEATVHTQDPVERAEPRHGRTRPALVSEALPR